jgi:hypothetical protein
MSGDDLIVSGNLGRLPLYLGSERLFARNTAAMLPIYFFIIQIIITSFFLLICEDMVWIAYLPYQTGTG